MDVISSVASALSILEKYKQANTALSEAEFNKLVADLSMELSKSQLELAKYISENAALTNEVRELKSLLEQREELQLDENGFYTSGDENKFCPNCYQSGKKAALIKSPKHEARHGEFKCPSCDKYFGDSKPNYGSLSFHTF